jgi:hypothetical protein
MTDMGHHAHILLVAMGSQDIFAQAGLNDPSNLCFLSSQHEPLLLAKNALFSCLVQSRSEFLKEYEKMVSLQGG